MADITISIPNDIIPTVLTAFSSQFDYTNNKLNGETEAQFAKRMVAEWIKTIVRSNKEKTLSETRDAQYAALLNQDEDTLSTFTQSLNNINYLM